MRRRRGMEGGNGLGRGVRSLESFGLDQIRYGRGGLGCGDFGELFGGGLGCWGGMLFGVLAEVEEIAAEGGELRFEVADAGELIGEALVHGVAQPAGFGQGNDGHDGDGYEKPDQ